MKSRLLKRALAVVLSGIIIAFAVGYYMWNKPHEKVEDQQGVVLTVDEIANAFNNNQDAANANYLDKAIQVSGIVAETEENQDGGLLVVLHGANPELTVQCTFREKNHTIAVGDNITVKGFCTGQTIFGDVSLRDAIVLNE